MLSLLAIVAFAPQTAWTFTIDTSDRKPISPYIYGINHPEWSGLGPGVTLARQGGNRSSAYNWETNASNAGNDWHHQNDGYMGESDEPGKTMKDFLQNAQSHDAAVILTVPTTGYVAADKKGDGDVNKTPDYINTRFHKSLPVKLGKLTYPPDTTDKVVYQNEFVAWIQKVKSQDTPVWFSLDNEPDLWGSTHQRIWPKSPTYAQIIANNTEYAQAIKGVTPKTLVFGPANYGWQGFRTFQNAPDANGRDFLDTYLAAMKAAESKAGKRLLDVLDIHWYPEAQGDGVRIAFGQDKPGTPAARIQAPRSLWDDTYVEQSWIADSLGKKPITLLPRIKAQIDKHYPGTKLAITEYNYGGANHISGTLAQADVLGIFGRYGLFAACNWGLNPKNVAELAGFKAFRDFDRKGGTFGDTALGVKGETASLNSVYAALDSKDPNRLTLVAINKSSGRATMRFRLNGFEARKARTYTVDANSVATPTAGSPRVAGSTLTMSVPGESVVTIELLR
ncbi:MAG: glycoside hydrolase family 44 protein [Fimbriimonas sp.]